MNRPATASERALGYALVFYWPLMVATLFPARQHWLGLAQYPFPAGLVLLGALAPPRRAAYWGITVGFTVVAFGSFLVMGSGDPAAAKLTWLQVLVALPLGSAVCLALTLLGHGLRSTIIRWHQGTPTSTAASRRTMG
jgi:hypothetical protein